MKLLSLSIILAAAGVLVGLGNQSFADPLPGEILKFEQLPLNGPLGSPPFPGAPFPGHDEKSTAYLQPADQSYFGSYMADDFSDKVSANVVHVQWWGSYLNQNVGGGVKQFLISFENDVPQPATGGSSHPGTPLLNQIVTLGPLAPGSGTFTETAIPTAAGSPDGTLFQYNAELALPFEEKANNVYWLKIVALTDNTDDQPLLEWGWHNRDYTQTNGLFATTPPVAPGERIIGDSTIPDPNHPGETFPVWHFQDDAVSGHVEVHPNLFPVGGVLQEDFIPQNYVPPFDGPSIIGQFSKDLAFRLYTVPEPGSVVMLGLGAVALAITARRRRTAA